MQNSLTMIQAAVVGFVLSAAGLQAELVGLWQFEDGADLGRDTSSRCRRRPGDTGGDFNGAFPDGIPTNRSYTISAWKKPESNSSPTGRSSPILTNGPPTPRSMLRVIARDPSR